MKKGFALLLVAAASGCGTVFSGTTQDISIDSNVEDVSVYIDGAFACKTPCVYPVERASGSISIVGKKKGYEDVGIAVKTKMNPVAWGNLTSAYSWTTDLVGGAAWKYRQDGVYLNMEKIGLSVAEIKNKRKETLVRRFVLFNYEDLKLEAARGQAGESIKALAELTGNKADKLIPIIKETYDEVKLAHKLASVK